MAWISTEDVKLIRNKLKKTFPEYKFSVRKGQHEINVSIVEGKAFEPYESRNRFTDEMEIQSLTPHSQINTYHLEFYGKNTPFFEKVLEIIKTGSNNKWYDKSDYMSDYFNVAFYIHLQVGRWDKPYKVKEIKRSKKSEVEKTNLKAVCEV